MSNLERPSGLNRVVLAIIGLVLLVAGGVVVAETVATLNVLSPDAPLVPGDALPPAWVWPVTAVCAVALGLLATRWLVAQADRTPKTGTWRFDVGPGEGRTELAARTAIAPLLAEVETYPGVHAVHGTLAGRRDDPALALVISTTRDGEPGTIRHGLVTNGLPRLRQALGIDRLPTTVEFHLTDKPGPRTPARHAHQEQAPDLDAKPPDDLSLVRAEQRIRAVHRGRVPPWISGSSG
ncbi:alkaline shock response membrane anchor protein AmaP [Lentzea sp. NPDC055074]